MIDTAPMPDDLLRDAIAVAKDHYEQLPAGLLRQKAHEDYIALVEEQMRRKRRKAA